MNGDYKSFFSFLSEKSLFTVSSHYLADVDAVCSAFLINSLFPKSKVVFFDKLSSSAREICRMYGFKYDISPAVDPTATILVDVDDPALIPTFTGTFLAVINHHTGGRVPAVRRLSSPSAPSTTHIIYNMMKEADIRPTPRQAELILLGIIADTYRFKSVGDVAVFADVAELLRISKVPYEKLLATVEGGELSLSERLVYARSFREYRILRDKESGCIFILSDCEAFPSLIATKIVECMGIDFALTYAITNGEIHMSARSSPKLGLHVGNFMSELAGQLGGSGGGHVHAAGATIPMTDMKTLEGKAIELLMKSYLLIEE